MIKIILATLTFVSMHSLTWGQNNVAINKTGTTADPSAILDVQSTTQGMLVPRMNKSQRVGITNPAAGLVVFDTDSGSFWFWSGSEWVRVMDGFTTLIRDTDNDTKVQVERTTDRDEVEFTVAGNSVAILDDKTLNITSNGNSTEPQLNVEESQASDFARINLSNGGISERWTISARNSADSSQTGFNIFNSNYNGNVMAMYGDGRIGIGTNSPDTRLTVRSSPNENPFRVRVSGSTKLLTHQNGGTSIGLNTTPPANGLHVEGDISFKGEEIYASDLLRLRSDTRIEIVSGDSKIILDPITGITIESPKNIDIDAMNDLTANVDAFSIASVNSSAIACDDALNLQSTSGNLDLAAGVDLIVTTGRDATFTIDDEISITSSKGGIGLTADKAMTLTTGQDMSLYPGIDFLLDGAQRVDIDATSTMEFTATTFDVISSLGLGLDAGTTMDLDATLLDIDAESGGVDINSIGSIQVNSTAGSIDMDAGLSVFIDGALLYLQNSNGGAAQAIRSNYVLSTCPTMCGFAGFAVAPAPSGTVFIGN